MKHIHYFLLLIFAAFSGIATAAQTVNTKGGDYAIHGYDTVAYFTEQQAVKGSAEFVAEYNHARWAFSSAENQALFKSDPEKYAPQFGGYCAFAAAQNALADVDPTAWSIQDGKLYLNYNAQINKRWLGDLTTNLQKGNAFWLSLAE